MASDRNWQGIRPIETRYGGRHFRSRREARWAVLFDRLHIPWAYETEGFDLDGLRYLPDFWLPDTWGKTWDSTNGASHGCWAEIKPSTPTKMEQEKASRLAVQSGHVVYIFPFDPCPFELRPLPDGDTDIRGWGFYANSSGDYDCGASFAHCVHCRQISIGWFGVCSKCGWQALRDGNTPSLLDAFRHATSMRFGQ